MALNLKSLIKREGKDSSLHNHLTLVYCVLPGPLPYLALFTATPSFVFSWSWYLRRWLGPFQGVTQFAWVSPLYMGGIHVIKLLFVFLLLSFITGGSQPEPGRVEGELFLLTHGV